MEEAAGETPVWVGVTYLIYSALLLSICIGGAGYAVFILERSGWWLLAGFLMACCGYSPAKWRALWDGVEPKSDEAPE